uniref:Uncharacterized protein n=1 Tax=Arundo donax TaxID=35708 RepID=A0A0A8Z983_ARUDO
MSPSLFSSSAIPKTSIPFSMLSVWEETVNHLSPMKRG